MTDDAFRALDEMIEGLGALAAGGKTDFPSAPEIRGKNRQTGSHGNGKTAETLPSSRVPVFPLQKENVYGREANPVCEIDDVWLNDPGAENAGNAKNAAPADPRARKENKIDGNYGKTGSSKHSCGVFNSRRVPVAGGEREVEPLLLADGRRLRRFRAAGTIPEPGESGVDARELIDEARDRRLVLVPDGSELHVVVPPGSEAPAILLEAFAGVTAEIIAFLRGEARARCAALDAKRPTIGQLGPGVPTAWREGYNVLRSMPVPRGFWPDRWDRIVADAAKFLPEWGARAVECGWSPLDVFGCDPDRPDVRFDCMGLVMLLDGFEIVDVDEHGADLATTSGAGQRFHRRPLPAHTVLPWEMAAR